jgi:hypothetical protein
MVRVTKSFIGLVPGVRIVEVVYAKSFRVDLDVSVGPAIKVIKYYFRRISRRTTTKATKTTTTATTSTTTTTLTATTTTAATVTLTTATTATTASTKNSLFSLLFSV